MSRAKIWDMVTAFLVLFILLPVPHATAFSSGQPTDSAFQRVASVSMPKNLEALMAHVTGVK